MKMFEANKLIQSLPFSLRNRVINSRDTMLCAISGEFMIDIVKLDSLLGRDDADYDPENSLYKGQEISMDEYITQIFGQQATHVINQLLEF